VGIAAEKQQAIFEAFMESESGERHHVAVKFANSYCKAAHVLLAKNSFAPHLRYCEKVESVGMHVAIMDFVATHDKEPKDLAKKVREAVSILHKAGFVHGDLRKPNVLFTEEGEIKIIDFDWCGKEGEVRYPLDINENGSIKWAGGVRCGGEIKRGHDQEMFEHLTKSKWEASDKSEERTPVP